LYGGGASVVTFRVFNPIFMARATPTAVRSEKTYYFALSTETILKKKKHANKKHEKERRCITTLVSAPPPPPPTSSETVFGRRSKFRTRDLVVVYK